MIQKLMIMNRGFYYSCCTGGINLITSMNCCGPSGISDSKLEYYEVYYDPIE